MIKESVDTIRRETKLIKKSTKRYLRNLGIEKEKDEEMNSHVHPIMRQCLNNMFLRK